MNDDFFMSHWWALAGLLILTGLFWISEQIWQAKLVWNVVTMPWQIWKWWKANREAKRWNEHFAQMKADEERSNAELARLQDSQR